MDIRAEQVKIFKQKLREHFVTGPFAKTSDPAFIEAMGHAGFDFVVLDLEHGPGSIQNLQNLIRAAEVADIFPIVRVKENNLSEIGEVLDIGAGGVQVPQISNEQIAHKVINAAKFSPNGMRGVCRYVRAANYSSMEVSQYFKEANETVVVMQLEGKQALENLDRILSVANIDIVFVGPYDLSQSLGVPGQVNHEIVMEKIKFIVDQCHQREIVVGSFTDNLNGVKKLRELGMKYICYSVDVGMFYEKCKDAIKNIVQGNSN